MVGPTDIKGLIGPHRDWYIVGLIGAAYIGTSRACLVGICIGLIRLFAVYAGICIGPMGLFATHASH